MSFEKLQLDLADIARRGHLRLLREVEGPQGRLLQHANRELLNFSSNNYLGLAEAPELRTAMIRGVEKWGVGAGASRLINGSLEPFHRLEQALAEFKGTEAALLFNSGYHANLSVLSCLLDEGDVIFSDALNHASMIDGMRLSRAKRVIYRHGDLEDLRRQLIIEQKKATAKTQFLIATETIFSMDGDLCDLEALLSMAEEFDTWLYLDEAHATGVFGATGAGLAEGFRDRKNFKDRVIQMGTLGKALGCFGAYVAGPQVLINFLINRARPFIYTTALSPAIAEVALVALVMVKQDGRRQALWDRVRQWSQEWAPATSPIIPIIVGEARAAVDLSEKLFAQGFWVTAVRPPTVPEGTARLRVTLMARHTVEDISLLIRAIKSSKNTRY